MSAAAQWYYTAPENSPQLIITSYLAGDYFQVLRNIIALS